MPGIPSSIYRLLVKCAGFTPRKKIAIKKPSNGPFPEIKGFTISEIPADSRGLEQDAQLRTNILLAGKYLISEAEIIEYFGNVEMKCAKFSHEQLFGNWIHEVLIPRREKQKPIEMSGTVKFEIIEAVETLQPIDEIETLESIGHADDDIETLTELEAFAILKTFNITVNLSKTMQKYVAITKTVTLNKNGMPRKKRMTMHKSTGRKFTFSRRINGNGMTVYCIIHCGGPLCADTDRYTAREILQKETKYCNEKNIPWSVEYWDGIEGKASSAGEFFKTPQIAAL